MYKFLVVGVALILQLGIKENHVVAQFYDEDGLGKYEVQHTNTSWEDAKQNCKNGGGNLAVIKSIFDEMMVKQIVTNDELPFVWLGLHEVRQSAVQIHWETATDEWVNVQTTAAWKQNIKGNKSILYAMEDRIIKQCGLFSLDYGVIPAPCEFAAPYICYNKLN